MTKNYKNADLKEHDFRKANLANAYFGGAQLSEADLSKADLYQAEFYTADLRNANLAEADLRGAKFHNADLRGANLQGANLYRVDFIGTKLDKANFTNASCSATAFSNVDLSDVVGLTEVIHLAPSNIDIFTLIKSGGKIPEPFLIGVGIPNTLIHQLSSVIAAEPAAAFYSCFISYSSRNSNFTEKLYADLRNKGVRCWYAPEEIKIGDKFRQTIDASIKQHDKLLLVLSENSISSSWVEEEVESALERERKEKRLVLFPVRIDDSVMNSEQAWAASLRRMRHIGDFTNWSEHTSYQKALARLLRDLKAER
jgi:hypothetical protein